MDTLWNVAFGNDCDFYTYLKNSDTNVDVKAVIQCTIQRWTSNHFQLGSILIFTSAQRLQTPQCYLIAQ